MNKRQAEALEKKAVSLGWQTTLKKWYRDLADMRTREWVLIVLCPCGCGLAKHVHDKAEFDHLGKPFSELAAYVPFGSKLHPDTGNRGKEASHA